MAPIGIRTARCVISANKRVIEYYPGIFRCPRLDTTMECSETALGIDDIANSAGLRNLITGRRGKGTLIENPDVPSNIQPCARRGRPNPHIPTTIGNIVGKGEAPATPSPLPRGGQFPPFTDVPVSGIGRLRPEYPLRGVICFDLRRLMIEVGQAQ